MTESVTACITKYTTAFWARSSRAWVPLCAVLGLIADLDGVLNRSITTFAAVYFPYCRWMEALVASLY